MGDDETMADTGMTFTPTKIVGGIVKILSKTSSIGMGTLASVFSATLSRIAGRESILRDAEAEDKVGSPSQVLNRKGHHQEESKSLVSPCTAFTDDNDPFSEADARWRVSPNAVLNRERCASTHDYCGKSYANPNTNAIDPTDAKIGDGPTHHPRADGYVQRNFGCRYSWTAFE